MCLDDQILNTYLDGELAEPFKSQVEEHLSYCSSCRGRYNSLKKLSERIKDGALSQEEIQSHQDRVLSMIEKNYLSDKKKKSILKKEFKFSLPQIMGVAAAFVIIFVGSFSVLGGPKNEIIPVPDVNSTIDYENIHVVRATDNQTTSRSLESYSLEEILKSLDARGYEVDIRVKGIQPIFNTAGSDVLLAATPVEEEKKEEAEAVETVETVALVAAAQEEVKEEVDVEVAVAEQEVAEVPATEKIAIVFDLETEQN